MESIGDASAAATSGKGYSALEKTIFILVNSRLGTSATGMFKLNIKITNTTNDSSTNTRNEEKQVSNLLVVVPSSEGDTEKGHLIPTLEPVNFFFEQDDSKRITKVACCQFRGSPEELYLIPGDTVYSYRETSPLIFNFKTNKTTQFSLPLVKKWDPIAAAIGESIYVLATGSIKKSREPRLEEYDVAMHEWIDSPECPRTGWKKYISGYVVVEDRLIVVCISSYEAEENSEFCAYNAYAGVWEPVELPPHGDHTSGTISPVLFGEGVVLFDQDGDFCGDDSDGIIYSYMSQFDGLLAFGYTAGPYQDLCLLPAYIVKGFQVKRVAANNDDDGDDDVPFTFESGAIAKVDHNILCVLYANPYFSPDFEMKVTGLIIQVDIGNLASCTILKRFTSALCLGVELYAADIKSCLVLQLDEQKNDLASEKEMNFSSTSAH